MTTLLDQAMERVKQLAESDQNAIASLILEEIEDEARWERAFARSQDALAKLAEEAMEEYREGKTEKLDPDKL